MPSSATQRLTLKSAYEVAADIFRGICEAIAEINVARAKTRRIQALWSLSDVELAARDLRREDIVRLVMADVI